MMPESVDMALASAHQPVLGIALYDKKIRNSLMRCWRTRLCQRNVSIEFGSCVLACDRSDHFLRQQNCGLLAR